MPNICTYIILVLEDITAELIVDTCKIMINCEIMITSTSIKYRLLTLVKSVLQCGFSNSFSLWTWYYITVTITSVMIYYSSVSKVILNSYGDVGLKLGVGQCNFSGFSKSPSALYINLYHTLYCISRDKVTFMVICSDAISPLLAESP